MKNERPKYSSFCCPTCYIETDRSLCKCPSNKEDHVDGIAHAEQKVDEESPLKKDSGSVYKVGANLSRGLRALIWCLVVLILSIIGAVLLNIIFSKRTPVTGSPGISFKSHGAVATDYAECSRIGTSLLREGGNAIDAAVAATVCIGVVAPHKTGLGGGGRMMIYSHRDRTNPLVVDFASNTNEGIFATAKVRVPSFLRGLEFAQSLRGNLPWSRIIAPSTRLAENGFVVSEDLAHEATRSAEHGMIYGHLRAGEILHLPVLAKTLQAVGQFGCDILYNGTLSRKIVRDDVVRHDLLHQLSSYEPRVMESQRMILHNHVVYLPRRANSFQSVIEELEKLNISDENASTLEIQILVARTIVRKVSEHADLLKFLEQERYSAVVAADSKENYVSIVTGLSAPLGLAHMTGAGFLLDSIETGNTLDALTPIIFHNEKRVCELRGVLGTDDPTTAAHILYNLLLRTLNVSASVEYPRFYVLPDGVTIEMDELHSVDPNIFVQLESFVPVSRTSALEVSRSVNAITKHAETLSSHSDSRGGGQASRY